LDRTRKTLQRIERVDQPHEPRRRFRHHSSLC
jgi:hypothetical protein